MPVAELTPAAERRAAPPPGGSSFLGRDQQLAELAGLLEPARLVTLSGPPGIGKSRLARELAGTVAPGYADGATLVELAAVDDADLVPAAVAAALSLQEAAGRSLADALVARLRGRRQLLVLDNCEHLVAACAELVGTLLDACPRLSILATSREPLGLGAEVVWLVPPLAVPSAAASSPEDVGRYGAVRLFVERAGAVEPRFALNGYVAPSVAEICRRLDGIPLAIELAAARVGLLTPAEIAGRLDDRFGLLTGAGEPSRHRTLEAALELSWALLSRPERALARRLSVFSGRFDREAVEAVCCADGVDADLLDGLVGKSLVVADSGSGGGRCRLLETIRAYATDRLERSGEAAAVREAHARFYLALAEKAEPALVGPEQELWFERLGLEHANLRAAIEWSVGHGRGDWALRLAGALTLFWRVRGHFSEGRRLLEAALSARDDQADVGVEAKALWGAALLTLWVGDPAAALPLAEASRERFEGLGDAGGRGRALLVLGGCRQAGDVDAALPLFEESAALARLADDSWCLAHALGAAGYEYSHRGDREAARAPLEESLTVARAARDKQSLRVGLVELGELAIARGDYRAAEPLLEEAVAVAADLGDDYTRSWALLYLGRAVRGTDHERARALFDQALDLIRETRPADLILPLLARARIAKGEGDRAHARLLLEEALVLARSGCPAATAALIGMGELTAEEGDERSARRLFEEALDLARAAREIETAGLALHALGDLARAEGHRKRATMMHSEALELRRQSDSAHGMVISVEALGGLAAEAGRGERAALLLGAAGALRREHGYGRSRADAARYAADLELVSESLPAAEFEGALERGAALSLEEAVAKASNGRNGNGGGRASRGWQSLSETERLVALLVAEGLTNLEIGERLFISRGTVKDHLGRTFSKLGITARTALAREVGRHEQQDAGGW